MITGKSVTLYGAVPGAILDHWDHYRVSTRFLCSTL